jgi:hypothetical protein
MTAEAWQKNFKRGIIPNYTDFRAHWVSVDIAAYIFSYRCPTGLTDRNAFKILKDQIPNYTVNAEGAGELVLRQPVTYSGPGGFNEWRFLYDQSSERMTVLFANLDSPSERRCHNRIIDRLKSFHSKNRAR